MSRFLNKLVKKTAEEGEGEFEVILTAMAHATGTKTVMAKNASEAAELAKDSAGDVEWTYEGIDESTIKTEIPGMPGEDEMGMPEMPEMEMPMEDEMAPEMDAPPEMGAPEPAPEMAFGSRFARKMKKANG